MTEATPGGKSILTVISMDITTGFGAQEWIKALSNVVSIFSDKTFATSEFDVCCFFPGNVR